MTMAPLSSTSIKVRFRIPHELDHFPPGLNYSIRYRSEFDDVNNWTIEKEGHLPNRDQPCYHRECEVENGENYIFLKNLLPYAEYIVQIKLLSAVANASDDRMWSNWAEQRNRTLPTKPANPPTAVFGGFEIVDVSASERNILAYWKQIDPREKNGPQFQYQVVSLLKGDYELPIHSTSKVTDSYASFPNLSSAETYRVIVTSANSQGRASKNTTLVIPSNRNNQLHNLAPRAPTKIVYNETLFEISWLAPEYHNSITTYTIFWCLDKNGHDRPYQCEGKLDSKEVNAEHRSVNISLPTNHVYQFAVAANLQPLMSSGMVWTSCTILHNKVLGRLKPVAIEKVESRQMLISWHLDCSDRVGVVTGYQISYCAIPNDDTTSRCIANLEGSTKMLNLETTADSNQAWIENLEPWTFYKVSVLVKTRGGSSKLSTFSVSRTLPAAPGEIRHLRGYLIDRRSVKLNWRVPLKPNGEIDRYEVKYSYTNSNNKQSPFDLKIVDPSKKELQIDGLMFYSNYEFQVRPCVKASQYGHQRLCGNTWDMIHIQTGIGGRHTYTCNIFHY